MIANLKADWSSGNLRIIDRSTGTVLCTFKDGGTLDVNAADKLTINDVIVPQTIAVSVGPILNANIGDHIFFVADKAYEVTAVREVHSTAESAGTVGIQLERLQGTEAPTAGDQLLTANLDGTGTANTVQSGTLVGTSAKQLAAGDRLAIEFTDDVPGELDGVVMTVFLKRI